MLNAIDFNWYGKTTNKRDEQSVELDLLIQKKNFFLFLTVKNAKCTILLLRDLLLPLLDSRSLYILTNWFQHKCFLTICSPTMVVFNKYGMSSLHFNHTTLTCSLEEKNH